MKPRTLKRLGLVLATLGFVVFKAPARLLDSALAHATEGGLRLQQTEGSLWQGHGVLASLGPDGRSLLPWLPLGWDFTPRSLLGLGVGWQLSSGGIPLGQFSLGLGGLALEHFQFRASAPALLSPIPTPVTRAGWQGDLGLDIPALHCSLTGQCQGDARLLWRGARSALFPGRNFGDYAISLQLRGERYSYQIQTLTGEIRLDARGEGLLKGPPTLQGRIQGDPDFLRRLPSIAGGAARPGNKDGDFILKWPPSSP
ncbi:type II secretion system protein N [Zoogloea sp.]|uniref:type II secretion system protein N n=1 Tax=Zoogloea sp. TaxID=49181 RepID=UPI0035B2E04D